jgi:hypothetical protein
MLAGCGEEPRALEENEAIRVSETESAGVRIVESSEAALRTPLSWVVGTSPDLELGEVDAAGPAQFARVEGVVGFADGSFVVLDAGSQVLRCRPRVAPCFA